MDDGKRERSRCERLLIFPLFSFRTLYPRVIDPQCVYRSSLFYLGGGGVQGSRIFAF